MALSNQKMENLLSLALEASPLEREKSQELEVGFLPETREWELIVKYSGSMDEIRALGVKVEELRNEYAILTVPEALILPVTNYPQIEYVEKPKRLFFYDAQTNSASCIDRIQWVSPNLTGRGTLVAILDSGIDYYHEDFRNSDGTTRILGIWDQVLDRFFPEEEINQALQSGSRENARQIVPSQDSDGHGTAVAGIAAGNGGVAYESKLLVVKLGISAADSFPRTTQLMRGVNAVINRAVELNRPVAVNISFGNTYGSHDGESLLETYLNDMSNFGRTCIVVGSGNEGVSRGHSAGTFRMEGVLGVQETVELSIAPYETGINIQLWKAYTDTINIRLQAPNGELLPTLRAGAGAQRQSYRGTDVLIYYGEPKPYTASQEIFFDLIPVDGYIDSGIWKIILTPITIVSGRYDLWLPSSSVRNRSTLFLQSTPEASLTIPSTADKVITVGAYDSRSRTYADFSGRGFTRGIERTKPDIAAPGVNVISAQNGGGTAAYTGTSFATPVVSGSAALLMQWGIVEGRDPFLYGEKMKAFLRKGAVRLPGITEYPNPMIGYGALCVANSLPN